tara:strand:- start:450 stop:980 length:531 start_codon:yes stop_codon:yes gene_type:complete
MTKKLIIMRGLPWTGKSYTAKEIAGEEGLIFSTDEYFYTQIKPEKPDQYSFHPRFLGHAHKWNYVRTTLAINEGHPLVIVDNTNTTASEPKKYVEYAINQDYEVEVQEPTSDRWMEIRELLYSKKANKSELKEWAKKLAEGSAETHNVPQNAIERMMWRWECDLTPEIILAAPDYQ